MRVEGFGLSVETPRGWEARLFRGTADGEGSRGYAVLHAGNFAIPADDSSFAQAIVRRMGPGRALIALAEYAPEAAHTALFTSGRWPFHVSGADLSPAAFPGDRPEGLGAIQSFVTVKGRAFCLYVVAGTDAGSEPALTEANEVLASLRVRAR